MTGKLNEPHGTERRSVPCGFSLQRVGKPCARDGRRKGLVQRVAGGSYLQQHAPGLTNWL